MASYNNFQTDNAKYTKNRYNPRNPEFNPAIDVFGEDNRDSFNRNLDKYIKFVSWARFYPDLFFDLITPETGGIRLDLDQRVFLRCISRFVSTYGVFPRGYGKCQAGDTIIFTEDGMKELGSFFNYSKLNKEFYIDANIKIANRYGQLESTNAGVYSGLQNTKIIETEEGYQVENSYNHPILVLDETTKKLVWKKTEDIKVGDYVPIARKINVWGNKTKLNINMDLFLNELSNNSRWKVGKIKCNIIEELDEEFALILGYLIGDGCLTRDNIILFTTKDKDILKNYTNFFENRLGVKVNKKGKFDYASYGKYLREYFRQIGLEKLDASNQVIPQVILEAPKKIVASFIRGLFDTNGGISNSYIEFSTASEKLSKQVQIVLLNFGIISTRTKVKKHNKHYYKIYIFGKNMDIFLKEIGFSCKRKQDRLIALCRVKRNINKDIIHYQSDKVRKFCQEAKINNTYLHNKVYHVTKGNDNLTYENLRHLLSLNKAREISVYNELNDIYNSNYFFSKVKYIKNSKNHVYDLSLPETNSFISNGFISHNTFLEVLGMVHTAIFYPNIEISMTAQTKENAASLLEEKWREIVRYYPLLKNELLGEPSFSKDHAEINFISGGRIDTLANAQSTKGQRRRRLNIEEAALLNNTLFEDVLEPVVNIPRRTIGKKAVVNPEELNGQINFFTTSGFRGSDEFERNLRMVDEMAELKGKMVLGSDWQLAVHYGRGEPKSMILDKKAKLSPTFFAMNYESKWVGASENSLIDINKVINLRTLVKPELKGNKKDTYILSVDVARSQSNNNNQTSIAVLKVKKNKDGKITKIQLVNLINLPNGLNFTAQAIEVKRIRNLFDAKAVVVDINGLGIGLLDELLKDTIDPISGDSLGCWATMNTDHQPDSNNAEKIVYALTAQGIKHEIIVNFIDMVESEKLQLLVKNQDNTYNEDAEYIKNVKLPHIHTDLLIEEIANLKLKQLSNGKYTTEQVTKRVDDDRFSALAMGLYYIKLFENVEQTINIYDYLYFNYN